MPDDDAEFLAWLSALIAEAAVIFADRRDILAALEEARSAWAQHSRPARLELATD
jgi:hypothetical protein